MEATHLDTHQHLDRIGAVAALGGVVIFAVSTLLHPMDSDPSDAPAAFAEYAADQLWVWSHLGQFIGVALLGTALVALASTFEPGRPAAWARIGLAGTAATIAVAAALQAVDGVALKIMVERWATATGEARTIAFEGAFAVRQIEIGLASLFSFLFGLTSATFSVAMLQSTRYPMWLGTVGLAGGIGTVATGAAQASMGFSDVAMLLSMVASLLLVTWFILAGILMWRLAPRLDSGDSLRPRAHSPDAAPASHPH